MYVYAHVYVCMCVCTSVSYPNPHCQCCMCVNIHGCICTRNNKYIRFCATRKPRGSRRHMIYHLCCLIFGQKRRKIHEHLLIYERITLITHERPFIYKRITLKCAAKWSSFLYNRHTHKHAHTHTQSFHKHKQTYHRPGSCTLGVNASFYKNLTANV